MIIDAVAASSSSPSSCDFNQSTTYLSYLLNSPSIFHTHPNTLSSLVHSMSPSGFNQPSPKPRLLFNAVILQSSPMGYKYRSLAVANFIGAGYKELLDCEDLRCLQSESGTYRIDPTHPLATLITLFHTPYTPVQYIEHTSPIIVTNPFPTLSHVSPPSHTVHP